MSRRTTTNRPGPPEPPDRPVPPEPVKLPGGWRIAVFVWLCAFGALVAFEVSAAVWKAIRSLF